MSTKYRVSFAKEKNEYAEIKKHNKTLNFNSIASYHASKNMNDKYIENPDKYFGHIWTSWYDFLQIDTSKFIQDKDEWVKFCKDKNVLTVEDYYNLCKIYKNLPLNPVEFYRFYTNLGHELEWKIKRRYYF